MEELPGDDCYPGGVSARDIDESQGMDDAPGWDPYDYQDDEDYPDEDGDE